LREKLKKTDRKSNFRILFQLIIYATLIIGGMMVGAVMQKYIGFGNVLRNVGVPYPTITVIPVSSPVPDIPETYRGKMRLFILAGQSNMVGWSPIPPNMKTDPRVYIFGADYHWRIASEPIFDAQNQVDKVSENRITGFGPSMPFAFASLERHPDIVIGLIPCAKNSSAIIQWQENISDQSLFGSCIKRVKAASPMGQISGLLFFQGEEDALDPVLYPQPEPHPKDWAQLFSAFVNDFRVYINQPDLPVIFAQIGPDPATADFSNWIIVKKQQALVDLPETAMIITDDLPLMDGLHFTSDGYEIIGKRFAEAYWRLIEK
jgi:hypothetical protein